MFHSEKYKDMRNKNLKKEDSLILGQMVNKLTIYKNRRSKVIEEVSLDKIKWYL